MALALQLHRLQLEVRLYLVSGAIHIMIIIDLQYQCDTAAFGGTNLSVLVPIRFRRRTSTLTWTPHHTSYLTIAMSRVKRSFYMREPRSSIQNELTQALQITHLFALLRFARYCPYMLSPLPSSVTEVAHSRAILYRTAWHLSKPSRHLWTLRHAFLLANHE